MSVSPEQTCADLFGLLDRFKRSLRDLSEEKGLTIIQVMALYNIQKQPGILMSQMASLLHCDASNVTGIVDRLTAQDLICRQECERDRRAKALRATEKGDVTIEEIMSALPGKLGCQQLSANDREFLHAAIQKIL
jgi:DNA-binding MarR family transcriptional regulator